MTIKKILPVLGLTIICSANAAYANDPIRTGTINAYNESDVTCTITPGTNMQLPISDPAKLLNCTRDTSTATKVTFATYLSNNPRDFISGSLAPNTEKPQPITVNTFSTVYPNTFSTALSFDGLHDMHLRANLVPNATYYIIKSRYPVDYPSVIVLTFKPVAN